LNDEKTKMILLSKKVEDFNAIKAKKAVFDNNMMQYNHL
jgi:hypothetical protein